MAKENITRYFIQVDNGEKIGCVVYKNYPILSIVFTFITNINDIKYSEEISLFPTSLSARIFLKRWRKKSGSSSNGVFPNSVYAESMGDIDRDVIFLVKKYGKRTENSL